MLHFLVRNHRRMEDMERRWGAVVVVEKKGLRRWFTVGVGADDSVLRGEED